MSAAQLDAAAFRRAMSHWATGVSVVASTGAHGPTGCTVNALTSLSLDPIELLVCFDRSSDTLQAIRESGRFSINVLAADQAKLSRRFATTHDGAVKFAGVPYTERHGAPVLHGCVVTLVCEMARVLDGGDHDIVIGRPVDGAVRGDTDPLIFYGSRYWLPAKV